MARPFVIVWLVLAALAGDFDVRLRLVRPDCCHGTTSCCPADHSARCCERELEVTVTGKRDEVARALEPTPPRPLDPALALAPAAVELVLPIDRASIEREPRLDAHPPPRLPRTAIPRL